MSTRLLCPWNVPGKKTRVGCHSLPQGIFPTQGSNLGLLHYRQFLYCLSHQGSQWWGRTFHPPKIQVPNVTQCEGCNSLMVVHPWWLEQRPLGRKVASQLPVRAHYISLEHPTKSQVSTHKYVMGPRTPRKVCPPTTSVLLPEGVPHSSADIKHSDSLRETVGGRKLL